MTSARAAGSVESVFREEHGRLLATLVRQFRDLDLAEDVASEAMEIALQRWPVDGVPRSPLAWLITTARRKAVDRLRRDEAFAARLAILHIEAAHTVPAPPDPDADDLPDERLRLFFACSHPALSLDAQVALTLRYLGGLSTVEVARAFLVAEATMQQRIVRAKNKIRVARIPFRGPEHKELVDRLPAVLHTLYVIFAEGYAASTGAALVRVDLCEEAIRLGPHHAQAAPRRSRGHRAARTVPACRRPPGGPCRSLRRSGPLRRAGPRPLGPTAHRRRTWARRRSSPGWCTRSVLPPGGHRRPARRSRQRRHNRLGTDRGLYDLLHRIAPSPVIGLNRAVAVAMRDTPEAGLALLESVDSDTLANYHLLPAARADLLRRLGRNEEAESAYRDALDLVTNDRERTFLLRRLAEVRNPAHHSEGTP